MSTLRARHLVIDIPDRGDGTPLDLDIAPGEVWGVLGPNGAGKTTLLHTLAGLRPPRRGEVLLDDRPLSGLRRRTIARQIAVVFQERQDGFPATVLETALIGRHPFLSALQMETAEDVDLARRSLAEMELEGYEARAVSTLSGGERQRLAVATALAQQPRIWLADEPSNHLDLRHQVAVMRLLRDQAVRGCSVFLCLHDINLAARWCDRILLLYPDGAACWGDTGRMLVPSALEQLYGQKLIATQLDGAPVFVPSVADTRAAAAVPGAGNPSQPHDG
ncbi:ABC transporter ATP-binding protein [Methylonatrum kenyense]|uniref:ABC transporter ATP-binding protein n=1 Tax=Methylonatrum kenyense TaxID=455253 RepID=UPI0020C030C7|nr:ABC transporter ATP-binding protein [Methylonatrum kenyense]MCK8515381.1 ABC transporter ATP-binding protein [Methylonatrum kenyense]